MMPDAAREQPEIVAVRALLDEALVSARAIADEDTPREAVAAALSEALRAVYAALALLHDAHAYREARATAAEHLREALGALQASVAEHASVEAVTRLAARGLQLLLVAPMPVLDPSPSLPRADEARPPARATLDLPRLLDLQRDVLRPMVPLPDVPPTEPPERETEVPPAPVTDLDALAETARASLRALDAADDAPPAPRAPPAAPSPFDAEAAAQGAFGERLTALDVLFERARGCLEDLGALGLARRPMGPEPWWCPRTEARLLTRIDALAACGEAVFPWLVRLLEERPVPDPELTWATVLFFACVAGDDAIDQAMRIARVTPLDEPELRASLADALTHAPHPGVYGHLAPWLDDPCAGRREVALVALGRRAALSAAALARHLAHDDPAVVRAALDGLAVTPDAVPEEALAACLAHADGAVVGAALDALVLRGSDLAARHAAARVRASAADLGDAAMHVAIGAGDDGLATLHGAGELTPVRCEALGWYGHAASVGPLLVALEQKSTAAEAARALWRITGAPLTDDDPAPDLDVTPFADAVWSDDELPECPDALSADAALWGAWWAAHGREADPAARWRFGRRWRVEDNVRVLAAPTSRPRDRRWAALELVARTGKRLPFEAWRFIPQQLAQIAGWREALAGRRPRAPWCLAGDPR